MLENWSPIHSGVVGGLISVLLFVWASRQQNKVEAGMFVLGFPLLLKVILVFGGIIFPPLAIFAIYTLVDMTFASDATVMSSATWAVITAINVGLAIAGPYTAYRVIFESVQFDESKFIQTRTLPKSRREILWTDIKAHGYNPWLQYYWIKPIDGPDFWYWDGMIGLPEFQTYLDAASQSRGTT